MNHIVQISVDVDDNRIRQICEESAAKQILDDVKEFSHGKTYYGNKLNDEPKNLREMFVEEIRNYIHEHADEVMQLAVQEVAKGMTKSKKFREAVDTVVNEVRGN